MGQSRVLEFHISLIYKNYKLRYDLKQIDILLKIMFNQKKQKKVIVVKYIVHNRVKFIFAREMKFGITSFYYFEDLNENLNLNEWIIDAKPIYSNYV